jgi:ATP-dependent DNA helicase RecQ
MNNLTQALERSFGLTQFRPSQREIIEAVLAGKDVLAVLPTGAGKSLCYQLPALLLPGVTIVISPLLSLMNDQVQALQARGIAAASLTSQTSYETLRGVYAKLRAGALKLLYISPERFARDGLLHTTLTSARVGLIAIDEAHCVSHWGHDFRPDYQALASLFAAWPGVCRLALTATADPRTRADIIHHLGLKNPLEMVASANRAEIFLSVKPRRKDGFEQILHLLQRQPLQSGLIYVNTQRQAETLALFLHQQGLPAHGYHAGLPAQTRTHLEAQFRQKPEQIMVATSAFGMGIDKADIRFVIHQAMPESLEAYAQQIGRAGRDGQPAHALLLFSAADAVRWGRHTRTLDEPFLKNIKRFKIAMIQRYAQAAQCRRQVLLGYFGEESAPCGQCDVCQNPPARLDVTQDMQRLLSAAYRMPGLHPLALTDHLSGVANIGADKSTYGIGAHLEAKSWLALIDEALARGWLVAELARSVALYLLPGSRLVLRGQSKVWMLQPAHTKRARTTSSAKGLTKTSAF